MDMQTRDNIIGVIAHSVVLDFLHDTVTGDVYPDGHVLYSWDTVTKLVKTYCVKRYRYYFVAEWAATARQEDYLAFAQDLALHFDRNGVKAKIIGAGIVVADVYTSL